jgi:capsid protein
MMSSDPYANHQFTRNTVSGFDHRNVSLMPESRLRFLRKLCRQVGKRGIVGPNVINTRVLLAYGGGLSLTPTPKAKNSEKLSEIAESIWDFYSRQRVSSCGLLDIHQVIRSVLENSHHAGDCFVVIRKSAEQRRRTGFSTCIEVIPGDIIRNPRNMPNGGRIFNGIEYNERWTAVAAHYAIERELGKGEEWGKIDLVKDNWVLIETQHRREAGQNRSLPALSPAIDEINLLDSFIRAYVTKAVINGKLTFISEGIDGLEYPELIDSGDIEDPKLVPFEDGTFIKAPAGGTVKPVPEAAPTSDAVNFIKSYAGFISASCFIPLEVLLKSFDKSYSAGTGALNECWRSVIVDRAEPKKILSAVYASVLEEAWINGDFPATGFNKSPFSRHLYTSSRWDGQPKGSLNPLADYKARQLAEQMLWTTGANNAAELGYKRSTNVSIRKREVAQQQEIYGNAAEANI